MIKFAPDWLKAARDRHAIRAADTRSVMRLPEKASALVQIAELGAACGLDVLAIVPPSSDKRTAEAWLDARARGFCPAFLPAFPVENRVPLRATLLGKSEKARTHWRYGRMLARQPSPAQPSPAMRAKYQHVAIVQTPCLDKVSRKETCPTFRRSAERPFPHLARAQVCLLKLAKEKASDHGTILARYGVAQSVACLPSFDAHNMGLTYTAKRTAPSRWRRIGKRDFRALTPKAYKSGSYHSRLDWIASLKANGAKGRIAHCDGPTGCPFTGNRRERETAAAPIKLASAMAF